MSVYSVKGKGWRYDFILKGIRHSEAGFKTKTEARQAESKRREEIDNPVLNATMLETPTDMDFLELVNRRLDHVKAYNSDRYYADHKYMAKRWIRKWGKMRCNEILPTMIQSYVIQRARDVSAYVGNAELRSLRAMFNFGLSPLIRGWIKTNPTIGIKFLPMEKRLKYVPPKEDVLKVIMCADPDTKDYLWTVAHTMGRISEINNLTWHDVDLKERSVVLYTRKKQGGHLTPRKVPMTERLFGILSRRFNERDKTKPWIFWHRYMSRKEKKVVEGPYQVRGGIMKSLCRKAGVKYFRFHALRHFGASMLDRANVPIGSIQRILGHENRTTTEIYLHSIGDAERSAINVLDIEFENQLLEKVPHQVPH